MNRLRISESDQKAIVTAIQTVLQSELRAVWIFGSRTKPDKKGGDIDIWIECQTQPSAVRGLSQKIKLALDDAIGEQKIDLQLSGPFESLSDSRQIAFHESVKNSMVLLWKQNL